MARFNLPIVAAKICMGYRETQANVYIRLPIRDRLEMYVVICLHVGRIRASRECEVFEILKKDYWKFEIYQASFYLLYLRFSQI